MNSTSPAFGPCTEKARGELEVRTGKGPQKVVRLQA